MKIAILTDSFPPADIGGAAVIAYNQALALVQKGHTVVVVTTTRDVEKVGMHHTSDGLIVHTVFSDYKSIWRGWKSMKNRPIIRLVDLILDEERPDVVHAHNVHYHLSYDSLRVAKKYSKRVFVTIHDSMPFHYSKLFPESLGIDPTEYAKKTAVTVSPLTQARLFKHGYNPFRNFRIKRYLAYADGIFAVSYALKKALEDNGIQHVEVIHNGINVDAWNINRAVNAYEAFNILRQRLSGKKVIFFGGRLSRAKGGDVLMKTLVELRSKIPNVVLLVVGDADEYTKSLQDQAEKASLKDAVICTGRIKREDMKYIYDMCTVVAAPSLIFDWFPTVILEAMACGKPAVGSVFGGADEMIVNGQTGFVVNPYRPQALFDALYAILSSHDLANNFGLKAKQRVEKEFSEKVQIDYITKHYQLDNKND